MTRAMVPTDRQLTDLLEMMSEVEPAAVAAVVLRQMHADARADFGAELGDVLMRRVLANMTASLLGPVQAIPSKPILVVVQGGRA